MDVEVSELVKMLESQDEETKKLKADAAALEEKKKLTTEQERARSNADALTKLLYRHAAAIRAGAPSPAGKPPPAKQKNACNTSLQAFNILPTFLLTLPSYVSY